MKDLLRQDLPRLLPEPLRRLSDRPDALWKTALGAALVLVGSLAALRLLATQPVLQDWILDVRGTRAMVKPMGSRQLWAVGGQGAEEITFKLETPKGPWFAKAVTRSRARALAARVGNPVPVVFDPKQPARVRVEGDRLAPGSVWAAIWLLVVLVGGGLLVAGRRATFRPDGPGNGASGAGPEPEARKTEPGP